MYSESRKAQRDRYARHRTDLVFSKLPARTNESIPPSSALREGAVAEVRARERVRAGIIGFVPATVTPGS